MLGLIGYKPSPPYGQSISNFCQKMETKNEKKMHANLQNMLTGKKVHLNICIYFFFVKRCFVLIFFAINLYSQVKIKQNQTKLKTINSPQDFVAPQRKEKTNTNNYYTAGSIP